MYVLPLSAGQVRKWSLVIGNLIIETSKGHLIHPVPKERIKQVSYTWQKLVRLFTLSLKTSGQDHIAFPGRS